MKPHLLAILLLAMLSASASPRAAEVGAISSIRSLFRVAMEDPGGIATGRLEGSMATKLREQYPGIREIALRAKVERQLEKQGCARFSLQMIPDGLPEGSPAHMVMNLNWCRDGSFPDTEVGER